MELGRLALFFKPAYFKQWTPFSKRASFQSYKQLQFPVPLLRNLYTHVRETGITGFDRNRKMFEHEHQGFLPSWLENCHCITQDEVEDLYKAFNPFVQDLTNLSCTNYLPMGNQRLTDMTEHIVPWAPIQAVQVVAVDRFYVERAKRKNEMIANDNNHTFRMHKFAWAVEMIARNGFVTDDIIDGSEKRNGLTCWHALPNIGMQAVNDFISLITGGFLVLDRYFQSEDYYADLVKFMLEIMHVAVVGTNELHAMKSNISFNASDTHQSGQLRPSSVSIDNMLTVKSHMNAGIILHLPIIGTMIMHGIKDPVLIKKAEEIGLKVMESSIMVDDWIDCFGAMEVNERKTSDIQNGRQSWLYWKAIELANPEQLLRLAECYGKNDEKCVEEIKEIYRHLKIKEIVRKMAEDYAKRTEAEIAKLPQEILPCSVWLNMLNHYRDVIAGKAARP